MVNKKSCLVISYRTDSKDNGNLKQNTITKKEIEETLLRIFEKNLKRKGLRIKAENSVSNATKKLNLKGANIK